MSEEAKAGAEAPLVDPECISSLAASRPSFRPVLPLDAASGTSTGPLV